MMSTSTVSPEIVAFISSEISRRGAFSQGREIRFRCPFPESHSNGDRHPSARWNPEKHLWCCDVCQMGGGALQLAQLFGFDLASIVSAPAPVQHQRPQDPVAIYDYLDEEGNLLFQVLRYDPKRFSQRRPDGHGGFISSLGDTRRVLYRTPDLVAGDLGHPVFLVEGEKDADRLASLGLLATTSPGGAGKWRREYCDVLSGRDVVLVEDNDDPGRSHVQAVAGMLNGTARRIRILRLPGLPPKGDVSDWFDMGGTLDLLWEHVDSSSEWTTEPAPPLPPGELRVAAETTHPGASPAAWPDPPDDSVYQGFAGEIVRAIDPDTEADPVAVLLTLLSAVGNIVGRDPHWRVGAGRHQLGVFPVLVGPTSKGRKGTAMAAVKPLLEIAAPVWLQQCRVSGLSSGEGLIWRVRDPIMKTEPIKDGKRVVDYQDVMVDAGIDDKRLFVTEEEFASILKVMGRDGNTLSAMIRQAWDGGDLQTLTKNSPVRSTDAHITILGHITQDELLRHLTSTEAANGFANRFIWVCVKRSKLLPDGGQPDLNEVQELGTRLRSVLDAARRIGVIERDDGASGLWHEMYGPLSEGEHGLLGAVTSRAEAQVMRLAAVYALLDESPCISGEHLWAARSLWEYSVESVRYIFGDKLGDPIADSILDGLLRAGEMTRTEIRDLFGRHESAARISNALGLLRSAGKVRCEERPTGGRPSEVWLAL